MVAQCQIAILATAAADDDAVGRTVCAKIVAVTVVVAIPLVDEVSILHLASAWLLLSIALKYKSLYPLCSCFFLLSEKSQSIDGFLVRVQVSTCNEANNDITFTKTINMRAGLRFT